MIEVKCPACGRMTSVHSESLSVGMEILCRECGSLLAVDKIDPLVLTELDLEGSTDLIMRANARPYLQILRPQAQTQLGECIAFSK